jgi:putative RNA 2'-phosphotransferase
MIGDERTDSQAIATVLAVELTARPGAQTSLLLRTVAHALRHAPEAHFLEMDAEGWVDLDLLVLSLRYARPDCRDLSVDDIQTLTGTGPEARFEIAGNKIRASYGHSRRIQPFTVYGERPVFLYHGTNAEAAKAIREVGLRPMKRNCVHLSSNWRYASSVANNKEGTPVVLVIGAYRAAEAGVLFRPANGHVWLADKVPAEFVIVPSPGQSGWGGGSCQ